MTTATAKAVLALFALLLLFLVMAGAFFVHAVDSAWVSIASMGEARSGLGVAVVNGKIYAIGGDGATGFSSANEEYDPATNTWTFKAPMPTPRSAFGVAVYGDKIYCIGGYTYGGFANSSVPAVAINEVYDPASDTWAKMAPMPTPRLNLRANVVDGKIYLIGGIPNPDVGRTLNEVYDPASNSWIVKAPNPTGVDSYASAVVGSKIFVIKSGLTQIYDAESDSWSTGVAPPVNSVLASAATVAANDSSLQIYLFGGNAVGKYWMLNNQGFTTQVYDPATGNWTLGTTMPTGRYDANAAAINDKIFLIGGYSYGAPGPGPSLNRPIIYSTANEQYTPALDVTRLGDGTQATPTPQVTLPTPSTTPTQSPTPTPIQTLSPSPTLTPTSTPSANQTPSSSSSPSASPTSNLGSNVEGLSISRFPILLLAIALAATAIILVAIAVALNRKNK